MTGRIVVQFVEARQPFRAHGYPQTRRPYPCPLSEEFWAAYQEPVWEWQRAAISFKASADVISNYAIKQFKGVAAVLDDELRKANLGLWLLNSLASSETAYYKFDTTELQEHQASTSLLSTMAKMFFLDVMAKRRLLRCGACELLFVSNDLERAKYCSVRCRNTAQVRRRRAALRAKAHES